jgi:hypothetical protein
MNSNSSSTPGVTAPAHLIIPRLWLGNKAAAADANFIRENNITVIVNASKNIPFIDNPVIRKYRVPVDDNLEDVEINNMTLWSPEIVYNLLKEYNAGNTILVHCAAGMQRSAAIVAMFLIVLKNMSAADAIQYIKSKRRIAFFPGVNFKRSIYAFERYYRTELLPSLMQARAAAATAAV